MRIVWRLYEDCMEFILIYANKAAVGNWFRKKQYSHKP